MLKEQHRLLHQAEMVGDSLIIALSFYIAYLLGDYPFLAPTSLLLPPPRHLHLLALLIPLHLVCLSCFGLYDSLRGVSVKRIPWSVLKAALTASLIFAAFLFIARPGVMSRTFLLVFFLVTTALLILLKGVTLYLLYRVRLRGRNQRILLIAGSGPRAQLFARQVESHPEWGLTILGYIDEEGLVGTRVRQGTVIGSFESLPEILDRNVVDEVVFIMPRKWLTQLEQYVHVCEKIGVKASVAVDFFDTAIAKPMLQDIDGWPFLTLDPTPGDLFLLTLKRLFDFTSSSLGLILCAPLFLVIAAAIKLTSEGPVFFRQVRCGVNGRTFRILKFRTMVENAEARLGELTTLNELKGPAFKIRNDPRITPVGRFLRKTSLDELPQLVNVFVGDMSLVGPRPPIPSEVERYERWQRRRLSMRPGITCIHEVVARNDKDFNKWMKLDLEYIDNWCFNLDLKILLRTVVAVVRGTGC